MFALIAAVAVAAAVSSTPSPSPSPIPQIAHVITSDRSSESLSRATRVTFVVTKDQIVRNGYRTISDALLRVPGVQIEPQGAIGALASYGIRGSNSSQVLVLIDGLPAPGSLSGTVDLGQLSTIGVSRIEVVEGGGSTLFGANAVGGVINIITDGTHSQPAFALRWGSFGDREVQLSAAGFSLERTDAENGYPIPSFTPSFGSPPPAFRENSDYEATTARYDGERIFGKVTADLDLGILQSNLGAPGYYPFVSNTSRQLELDENAGLTLQTHGSQSTTTLQLGGTQQQLPYDCNDLIDSACFQPSESLSYESRLELGLRNSVDAGSNQLLYGADLSRGTVLSNTGGATISVVPPATPPPPSTTNAFAQTGIYAQDVFDVAARTQLYAGIRGERDGGLGGAISPALGLKALLSHSLTVKVNVATAFRAPNASELYYPGYGNPNLVPERSRLGDVTLSDPAILGGTSLGWFVNATHDLIVSTLTDPTECAKSYVCTYEPLNIDTTLVRGFTFDTRTPPYRGISVTLNATDLYTAQDLTSDTRLPYDPVLAVNVGVEIAGDPHGLFGGAAISERVVGSRGTVDVSQPLFFQPAAYANLTSYVDLHVAPRMSLFLRGYNLGNERYAEIAGYPMPGRSFAVELRTR